MSAYPSEIAESFLHNLKSAGCVYHFIDYYKGLASLFVMDKNGKEWFVKGKDRLQSVQRMAKALQLDLPGDHQASPTAT